LQYGSSLGSSQARANICSNAAHGGLIPGSAICRRLINPVGFDKTKLPARLLMMDRANKANRRVPQNSTRSKPREVTAAAHDMAADPKARKKARPQRPGFFVFRGAAISGLMPG
jgi:hypothetical protein